ncbi:MAG TPA: hypothetical protein VHE58_04270 [Burkholderiales bacterium]|nr:hypothetical protein [Burkholderiales bacterium]
MLEFIARLPGRLGRLYGWFTGRRPFPPTVNSPRQLYALIAHNMIRRSYFFRTLYAVAASIFKYKERILADRINFGARLHGPVTVDTLRNAVLWQRYVLNAPPSKLKAHANFHISGNAEQVQLDRLMSLLLMSDVFANVNVFFDEQAAHDAHVFALTVAEERRGREDECDLDASQQVRAEMFDNPGWTRIFSTTGFERNANNYLKTAHPGAFVVALGLPENDEGFCDEWIGPWEEAVRALAPEFPDVTFVVLNRVGPIALQSPAGSMRSAIAFARKAGLTLAEAACLARKADAFIGQMDMFGLAARAARRPGVYMMSPERADLSDPEAGIIHTGLLAPNEAMAQFRALLANRPAPAAAASKALSDSESNKRLRR